MSDNKNREEFYAKLKQELENTSEWPSQYLYKFIVTSEEEKIKQVEGLFDNMGAVINTKQSSKGKYTSVSISLQMDTPDDVIAKYKEAEKIEGIISL